MKRILEISDVDLGIKPKKNPDYKPRTAARAIVLKDDMIALLHVQKHHYHKLPGGGVKDNESIIKALEREVLEETGCKIEVKEEVGEIIEHKSHQDAVQTSHCFLVETKTVSEPKFTRKEKSQGFKLVWIPINEAIKLLENDRPSIYMGKFIRKRDLYFLQKGLRHI